MYQLKQNIFVILYKVKSNKCLNLMPQKTLRFKIYQDGRVEETVEGFTGSSCNEATKNLENALGKVTVKNKTSDAFISNQNENLKQLNNESNVTF